MQADYVQRLRLTFKKFGAARYIGHLDLARTLERAFNRARLPIAYSHGFNRRPRLQLASALPLGYTSECELADIWLLKTLAPEDAQTQIMAKMAPGIEVIQVVEVPLKEAALQTQTVQSGYSATLLDPVDRADLEARVAQLMAKESIIRERGHGRKRKEYDLRPLIRSLEVGQDEENRAQLKMMLQLMPAKTGRPDEVLLALDLDPLDVRIHRTQIVLAGEEAVLS